MSTMASQITSLTIVYSTVYSGTDERKHQSSMSLAFVRGIHRWPVNSPHKGPVTRKMFPFDKVIMFWGHQITVVLYGECQLVAIAGTIILVPCQGVKSLRLISRLGTCRRNLRVSSTSAIISHHHIDGLVQDCSISIANVLGILQSCAKPSISILTLGCCVPFDGIGWVFKWSTVTLL